MAHPRRKAAPKQQAQGWSKDCSNSRHNPKTNLRATSSPEHTYSKVKVTGVLSGTSPRRNAVSKKHGQTQNVCFVCFRIRVKQTVSNCPTPCPTCQSLPHSLLLNLYLFSTQKKQRNVEAAIFKHTSKEPSICESAQSATRGHLCCGLCYRAG